MKNYKGWKFKGKELSYIKEVLSSDFKAKSSGTMNERLEIKFAKIHNQHYAVTANSGTSTLHMALNAFGVGHGDEVIIPGLTVAMCGYAVWQCGAVPVYADIKKDKEIRLTLDYLEDLIFFKKIFSKFTFTVKTNKVINYLKRFKNIGKINYFRQNHYLNNQKKNYERL